MAMATTVPNLSSLSSHSPFCPSFSLSATSSSFQIPKKRTQISCLARKSAVFVHPIKHHELGHGLFSVSINGAVDPTEKARLVAVKATEVVAPTSEKEASNQSKSSKKKKNVKSPRRILDIYQILQYPIITESAIKNVAEENALLFTVDVRADKKMIRDAFVNFFGVKVRKVNTSIRPDGTKKAFIMLSREYNASEIAKNIGIFPK